MRHHRLDLNLLIALEALLETSSVTAAANCVHVSQPSMSGSLARLREHFGDQLLMKSGRALRLTPLATRLKLSLRSTMEQMDHTLGLRPTFDPLTDAARFAMSGSDFTVLVLGSPLMQHLSIAAPMSRVEWQAGSPAELGVKLQSGDLDIAFLAEPFLDGRMPSEPVIENDYVCIAWTENEHIRGELTREVFSALGHVDTRYGPKGTPGASHRVSRDIGMERRVEAVCPSPVVLGAMVVNTQRVATLGRSLAMQLARSLALHVYEHPWPMPKLRIFMQWNPSREGDEAFDWLRRAVVEVAGRLTPATLLDATKEVRHAA